MDQYWGTNLRRWLKLPETVSILERLSPPDNENTAVGPRFFESMHVDGILYPNPFSPIPEIISTGWREPLFKQTHNEPTRSWGRFDDGGL